MIGIMRSLLLILVFALVMNSQARTLTEKREAILEGSHGGKSKVPPPSPKSATPIEELSPLFASDTSNYGRPRGYQPPPKPATPVVQMDTISRKPRSPPPAPELPPPHHQVSGGGVLAAINELLSNNSFVSAA